MSARHGGRTCGQARRADRAAVIAGLVDTAPALSDAQVEHLAWLLGYRT